MLDTAIKLRASVDDLAGGDLSPHNVHELTGALKDLTELMHDYCNIPTEQQRVTRERLEIERQRLKMEQREHEASFGDNAPVQKWVIEMGGNGDGE